MLSPLLSLMILAFFAPWGAYAEFSTTTICRMGFETTSTRTIRTRTTTVRSVSTSTLLVLSYPTRTITPPVVTQTSSASKTITATRTADQDTTITITLREAALTTTTSTSFLTVPTVITTTTTLLADVPSFSTSPGFMPIQSVHGNPPERKRKLLPPVENNDLESALPLIEDDSLVRRQYAYPTALICDVQIEGTISTTITQRASSTIAITAPARTTKTTITTTLTTTSFKFRDTEVATDYQFTTSTSSSTSTFFQYSITLSFSSTSTVTTKAAPTPYPGCQPDNFISSHDGSSLNGFDAGALNYRSTSYPFTGDVDCCQLCQQLDTTCAFFSTRDGSCNLYNTDLCNPQYLVFRYFSSGLTSFPKDWTFGNGNCGYGAYAGVT
jgi:hypothetical protein